MPDQSPVTLLAIERIRTDGDTQPRCALTHPETVADYAELLEDGIELPPGVVFFDGEHYWLAEGFQRLAAHKFVGRSHFPCRVHTGGVREARLHAAGSNGKHGLRRNTADVHRAVRMVLADPEAKTWPVEKIAAYCHTTRATVKALQVSTPWPNRPNLFGEPDDLGKPPAPDYALEDVAATRERMRRSARKFLRFCERIGEDPLLVLRELLAELEAKRPAPQPAAPVAEPESNRLTLEGACQ